MIGSISYLCIRISVIRPDDIIKFVAVILIDNFRRKPKIGILLSYCLTPAKLTNFIKKSQRNKIPKIN